MAHERIFYPMMITFLLMAVNSVTSDFPPGFRPISAIPDEFFTCVDRAPGPYADDKRSCALYWNCLPNGTLAHIECPATAPVFDDRVKACVKSKRGMCPVDYGFYQSAVSFCRGRPYRRTAGPNGKNAGTQQPAQAYYANLVKNCDRYFWCFLANGQYYGFEFECPKGQKFQDNSTKCVKADLVKCSVTFGADLVSD